MKTTVVFLDRDGTINVDYSYLVDPTLVKLFPNAADAIARFNKLGLKVVIASNQSAVARGIGTIEQVESVNCRVLDVLLEQNPEAVVHEVVYCPHGFDEGCDCRKPKVGMIKQLKAINEINLKSSWMIGDKISDIMFGRNLGLPMDNCLLVLTGYGRESLQKAKEKEIEIKNVFDSLWEASLFILDESLKQSF